MYVFVPFRIQANRPKVPGCRSTRASKQQNYSSNARIAQGMTSYDGGHATRETASQDAIHHASFVCVTKDSCTKISRSTARTSHIWKPAAGHHLTLHDIIQQDPTRRTWTVNSTPDSTAWFFAKQTMSSLVTCSPLHMSSSLVSSTYARVSIVKDPRSQDMLLGSGQQPNSCHTLTNATCARFAWLDRWGSGTSWTSK